MILITVKPMRTRFLAVLGALVATAGAACGPGGAADGQGAPLVVATTSILGDVAERLVGDRGTVETLMPAGADPHSFQASARQAARIRQADLVLTNGLGLEEGLQDVIDAAEEQGANVLELAPLLDPIPLRGGGGAMDDLDPHVWLDPVRMAEGAVLIGEALVGVDRDRADEWRQAAGAYQREVLALHDELKALVERLPADRRKLVTSHEALGYLADRYGFEIVGVVVTGGSTMARPTPSDLADLVATLEREGVSAIFVDASEATGLAEAIVAELGRPVGVVTLYTGSLGGEGSGAQTYLDMLRLDVERIVEALEAAG